MCTGLEPLFLAAGVPSAAAGLLATGTGYLGAGLLAKKALKQPQVPQVKPLTAADKPPAPSKAPDRAAILYGNAAAAAPGGALSGTSSTFLTGPKGVDPSTLTLGRNTLLGQ